MANRGLDPRTPVLVGVGQVTSPLSAGEDLTLRDEPAALMARAVAAAAEDAGAPDTGRRLLERAQSIRVVAPVITTTSRSPAAMSRAVRLTRVWGLFPPVAVSTDSAGSIPRRRATASPGLA